MINLNTVEKSVARAIASLREPHNQKYLEFIQSQVDETKAKLVKADDMVLIHRLQGRAEAFDDLLQAVDDAVRVINRA